MKVRITVDLSDADRAAIADFYGKTGLAPRKLCADFLEGHVAADVEGVVSDYETRDQMRWAEL